MYIVHVGNQSTLAPNDGGLGIGSTPPSAKRPVVTTIAVKTWFFRDIDGEFIVCEQFALGTFE